MEFEPGTEIGPFRIERVIGRGGSATVYRANDPRFGAAVAVKVLASHLVHDPEAVEQFVGEARALRLIDHDAVVTVFDVAATADGQPYMVLRYADRGSLSDRLPAEPASNYDIETLIRFLGASLGALHQKQLIHRDVKPSNVLVTSTTGLERQSTGRTMLLPDERFVLGDLGLVKDVSGGAVTRGAGSHGYAAPEQRAIVSRVDRRTDVFGASAVVAEVSIGRTRRPDEPWVDLLQHLRSMGHDRLANVLATGLAEDPAERFEDIGSWELAALGAVGTSTNTSSASALGPRRSGLAMAVAAIAFLSLFAFGVWSVTGGDGGTVVAREPSDVPTTSPGGDSDPDEVAGRVVEAEPTSAIPSTPTSAAESRDDGGAQSSAPVVDTSTAEPIAEPTASAESTTTAEPTATAESTTIPETQSLCPQLREGEMSGLGIVDATNTTLTIEYQPTTSAVAMFVNGRYFDNARKESNQFVFQGLNPDTRYSVTLAVAGETSEEGTTICATTMNEPVERTPIGVMMASDLAVVAVDATSATLQWTPPAVGSGYTLYRGTLAPNKAFPNIVGEGGRGFAVSSYTFENLTPGETIVLGLRTTDGPNQSGLAWVEYTVP